MDRRILLNSLDYVSMIEEIRSRAAVDMPNWDFENPNDVGRYIIELVSALIERHNVYSNSLANECFIETGLDPDRLTVLAHQYGYLPNTPQPGTVELRLDFVLPPGALATTIPPYQLRVKVAELPFTVYYENQYSINLPANSSGSNVTYSGTATFIEGLTKTVSFTATGVDFQKYVLNDTGIILDKTQSNYGITVLVNGVPYTYTPTFMFSLPGDRPFRLLPHLDGKLSIQFSDNFLGEKPIAGDTIVVTYRVGGGIYNFQPNKVRLVDTVPANVVLSKITQLTPTQGGNVGDTLATIKARSLVLNDYGVRFEKEEQIELFGTTISGVGRLKVSAVGTLLIVTVIPTGLGIPTPDLEDRVVRALLPRVPMGYDFTFVAPSYKEVGLQVRLRTNLPSALYGDRLYSPLVSIINRYLHPLSRDTQTGKFLQSFGGTLKISELLQTIKDELEVFDYEVQWLLRGSSVFLSTDLSLNLGEITTADRETPAYQQGAGSNIFKVSAVPHSSLNKFIHIDIQPGTSANFSSNVSITGTAITYTLYLSSIASNNNYQQVAAFIEQDANNLLPVGTYLPPNNFPIYKPTKLLSAIGTGTGTVVPTAGPQLLTIPPDLVNLDILITN